MFPTRLRALCKTGDTTAAETLVATSPASQRGPLKTGRDARLSNPQAHGRVIRGRGQFGTGLTAIGPKYQRLTLWTLYDGATDLESGRPVQRPDGRGLS